MNNFHLVIFLFRWMLKDAKKIPENQQYTKKKSVKKQNHL